MFIYLLTYHQKSILFYLPVGSQIRTHHGAVNMVKQKLADRNEGREVIENEETFTIIKLIVNKVPINSNQMHSLIEQYLSMQGDLTPEQFDKVLHLCSILGLEDFILASNLLKQSNWNIQAAMGLQESHPQPNPNPSSISNLLPHPDPQHEEYQDANYDNIENIPLDYDVNNNEDVANEYEYEYEYYQKQFDRIEKLERKKKEFDQGFESIPLLKTKSEVKCGEVDKLESHENEMRQNHHRHRFQYETGILQKSSRLCERLVSSKSPEVKTYYESMKKNENNRQFLAYLHKKYNTNINFTFGTFLLNLARSYLDKKFLLVYIHKSEFEDNKSISMLLKQKQIAQFVNKNCVCYGMFDSSDDYEVLHNYVPMKNLPAFALFKLNKKQLKQDFISEYPVLQSEPENFLQWLASNIGVTLKKKQKKVESSKMVSESQVQKIEMSNIIYEQNLEYEQMARLYEMKRNKSKLRKESLENYEMELQRLRQNFKDEPKFEPGVTLQARFRLPISGNSLMRTFNLTDKINVMFEYIHCFGRDEFQEKLANFDLTQTFPKLSLEDKKEMLISQVFGESERENIIVKEL